MTTIRKQIIFTLYLQVNLIKKLMRKAIFWYILLGLIVSLCMNLSNVNLIKKANPTNLHTNTKSLLNNVSVWSIDNEYYLTPPENFVNGKGWKRSPGVSNGDYYRRTPGYSILYYVSLKLFGNNHGILGLIMLQNILYLLSIYCVFFIANSLFKEHGFQQKLLVIMYSILPYFYSYNFFTLTEAISLFLAIFSLYFTLQALYSDTKKRKYIYYFLASIFISYNTLTRPFTGLLVLIVPFFIVIDDSIFGFKNKLILSFVCMTFFLLPISIWTIRNYAVSKEIVVLEKYMHPQSLDRTKPEFSAFWSLTQCWGEDGGAFNGYFMPFYDSVLADKSGDKQIQDIANLMNHKFWSVVSKDEFQKTLYSYRDILKSQQPYYQSMSPMPNEYTNLELDVTKEFDTFKAKYISANPIDYYVKSPIKYYKDLVINSYSAHLFLFQAENVGGNIFLKLTKLLMLVIYILMHLSVIGISFLCLYKKLVKKNITMEQSIVSFLSILCLLFVAILVFLFRAIEQRYFHPYLIFILIAFIQSTIIVSGIFTLLFQKVLKSKII